MATAAYLSSINHVGQIVKSCKINSFVFQGVPPTHRMLSMSRISPLRTCFELRLRKDVPNDVMAFNFGLAVQDTANHLMRQNTDVA